MGNSFVGIEKEGSDKLAKPSVTNNRKDFKDNKKLKHLVGHENVQNSKSQRVRPYSKSRNSDEKAVMFIREEY